MKHKTKKQTDKQKLSALQCRFELLKEESERHAFRELERRLEFAEKIAMRLAGRPGYSSTEY